MATELLRAVADGREDAARQFSEALADHVLSTPVVRAALLVREGGPRAIARAVGLAERVLEALAMEAPASAPVRVSTVQWLTGRSEPEPTGIETVQTFVSGVTDRRENQATNTQDDTKQSDVSLSNRSPAPSCLEQRRPRRSVS